jgi:hypothetical protein
MGTRYDVDIARDDEKNLKEVLEYVATRTGHQRIVSIIFHPPVAQPTAEHPADSGSIGNASRAAGTSGSAGRAGSSSSPTAKYVIVSETNVP